MAIINKIWRGTTFNSRVKNALVKRLRAAAFVVEGEAKRSMRQRGPSTPGTPPGVQTGTLRSSVTTEVNAAELTARVGTNLEYAPYLELGTRKMEARPFLQPALEKSRLRIQQIFDRPIL